MKAPKLITWFVAVLIGLLAVLLKLGVVAVIGLPFIPNPFWLVVGALILLALAAIVPGL